MEKVAQIFRSQVMNAKKSLENILDQDSWSAEKFDISNDYSSLQSVLKKLPQDTSEKILSIFGNLHTYFSAGLFLYNKNLKQELWYLGSAFRKGQFHPLEDVLKQVHIKLPKLKNGDLKKTAPYSLLHPFDLCEWCDGTDSSAFVYKFNDNYLGIFFLELPEPWLRLHVENIHKIISKTLLPIYGK